MARTKNSRAAAGAGSIRQRVDGRWEARFTYLDELGQKKRGSVYADSQQECRKKLTAAIRSVDAGTYHKAKRYTVDEWFTEWLATYCTDLKPATRAGYKSKFETRIKPYIGSVQLTALNNIQMQKYFNKLCVPDGGRKALAPKSIQNIHGILHKGLKQAVIAGLIQTNPADYVKLPSVKKPDLQPIMDDNVGRFLSAITGDKYEHFFFVDIFSGLRMSELIALQWDDVDLENGLLTVRRQIQKQHDGPGYIYLDETKNGKQRVASIAPSVVSVLRAQRIEQTKHQLAAGPLWKNERNLVFTDEFGEHLKHRNIYNHFKRIAKSIGMPSTRFHDLRHSYAVNALQAGDNIKQVQEQLGHYSSAFTMDVYAAVSETMRKDSQDRMERLIRGVSGL